MFSCFNQPVSVLSAPQANKPKRNFKKYEETNHKPNKPNKLHKLTTTTTNTFCPPGPSAHAGIYEFESFPYSSRFSHFDLRTPLRVDPNHAGNFPHLTFTQSYFAAISRSSLSH